MRTIIEHPGQSRMILLADDDPDDRMMAEEALQEANVENPLAFVTDGEELLDYLRGTGDYADDPPALPGLILLDLNMPRMDGREALRHIKEDERLRHIPKSSSRRRRPKRMCTARTTSV